MQLARILQRDREFDMYTYEIRALVRNGKMPCAPLPFDFRALHERNSLLSVRMKDNLAYRYFTQQETASVRFTAYRDFQDEALATKQRMLRDKRRLTVYWQ